MKEWWHRKKSKTRKAKKNDDHYTFGDFLLDVLLWVPELVIFPLRMIFWLFRGIGRLIMDVF